MSYHLPDLLTPLSSLVDEDDDSTELQINPNYQSTSNVSTAWLLNNFQHIETSRKTSHLQKTLPEFLSEYNSTLLASTYFPIPSTLRSTSSSMSVSKLQIASEWLALCALCSEDVLRPGRILDSIALISSNTCPLKTFSKLSKHPVFQCIISHMTTLCADEDATLQKVIKEFLDAHSNPLPPPKASAACDQTAEYLKWRIALSGLRPLLRLFCPVSESSETEKLQEIILEIIVCVMDLLIYNVHQAWHQTQPSTPSRNHLNIIAFIQTQDPELTLQGAINIAGEMIQEHFQLLKIQLTLLQKKQAQTSQSTSTNKSRGVFSTLLSVLFPSAMTTTTATINTRNIDELDTLDKEMIKTLFYCLTGTIHWIYEVDYFTPELGGNSEDSRKKKKSGDIRDYGWVFLIKKNDVEIE